jgi:conjugative transfer signal peptidase TraF
MKSILRSVSLGSGSAVFLALLASHLRFNSSTSLPRGIYWLEHAHASRADLVLFCPPAEAARLAAERHYLRNGSCPGHVEPMGKILIAAPGDLVELTERGISINGQRLPSSLPRAIDSRGRPLAHYPYGVFKVDFGKLWVYSPHPLSFDSRYFGPVPASLFVGTLRPLYTASAHALNQTVTAVRALPGRA